MHNDKKFDEECKRHITGNDTGHGTYQKGSLTGRTAPQKDVTEEPEKGDDQE